MDDICAFRRRLLALILACLCLGGMAARADDPVLTLQLSLGRFGHGFTLYYLDGSSGNTVTLAPDAFSLTPQGVVGGNGQYQLASDSHLELRFSFDSSQFPRWWLSDDTTSEFSQLGTSELRITPWAVDQPYVQDGNAMVSNMQSFAVPESRYQHALTVILDNGTTYPVTQGAVLGENAGAPGGTPMFRSYGFFDAWAYVDSQGWSFQLVDLSTNEQAPANTTDLVSANWGAISLPSVVHVASILVGEHDAGNAFTFHTSSGSMQSVYPSYASGTDPATGQAYSGYVVAGSVGAGATS